MLYFQFKKYNIIKLGQRYYIRYFEENYNGRDGELHFTFRLCSGKTIIVSSAMSLIQVSTNPEDDI